MTRYENLISFKFNMEFFNSMNYWANHTMLTQIPGLKHEYDFQTWDDLFATYLMADV